MTKDIKEFTDTELKAIAYDTIVEIESKNKALEMLAREIQSRIKANDAKQPESKDEPITENVEKKGDKTDK